MPKGSERTLFSLPFVIFGTENNSGLANVAGNRIEEIILLVPFIILI